jgi:hypothetical protein
VLKTRIVVVAVRRMTGELIRQVFGSQPGTVVEAVLPRSVTPAEAAAVYDPDLLIVGVENERLDELDALLEERPKLTVLGVIADGRSSFLYRLRPQKEWLGELSPTVLLSAARGALEATPG